MDKIRKEILKNVDEFVCSVFAKMEEKSKDVVSFMLTSKDKKNTAICKVSFFDDYFEVELVNYLNINELLKFKIDDVL